MPGLSIHRLRKVYKDQIAVDGVTLDVQQGEFVALLGPSGCGKTTLLRTIAGLVEPTSGDVAIDGQSIVGVPAHRRGIGMVFQSYALFPHMTVLDNVAFGLRMHRVPTREVPGLVREALRLVRLEHLGERFPHQLSGGQQQRVAIARAIATKPKVLLLDEPLAALDAKLREVMRIELTQLQRGLGVTTVFVTHDQQEALAMADRVAVLHEGRLEQFDSPKRIYERPASAFVADFVGQMNHLAGKVLAIEGGTAQIVLDETNHRISALGSHGITLGHSVTAMIRPERMMITGSERHLVDGRNSIHGVVTNTLFTGETTHWIVGTEVGNLVVAARQEDQAIDNLQAGSPVSIVWRTEDTHLFPRN